VSQFPQGPGMPMEQPPHIGGDLAPYLNHEELAILLGLGERLVSELDADNVLKLVAKTACEVVQAETLVVPIIDFKGQTYSYAASSGKYADQLQGLTLPLEEGACGWVMKHQRPLLFGEDSNFDMNVEARWEPGMASSLLVPLICRGRIIGGLSAMGKCDGGTFNKRDLAVLTLFANQASIAIDNARLFQALRNEESRVRLILDSAGESIYGIDTEGNCTFANPACWRTLGYRSEAELVGRDMHMTIHHSRVDGSPYPLSECCVHQSLLQGQEMHAGEETYWRSDGTPFPVEYWSHPLLRGGGIVGAVVTFIDISERKQAEMAVRRQKALLELIIETIPLRVFWKDLESRYIGCNSRFAQDAGLSRPEELLGKTDYELGWRDQADLYRTDDKSVMASGVPKVGFEEPQTTPNGGRIWLRTSKVPLGDEHENIFGVLGVYEDITEWKRAEEQIRNLANFDPLTNLPNRRLLMDRLRKATISAGRDHRYGVLMMLDLDHFKDLNDTQGHDTGDRLLIEVAHRLTDCVREEDTVSRLGGDEYVIIAENLGIEQAAAAMQAETIAEKVRHILGEPYALLPGEQPHHSTTSIGVTLFHGQDVPLEGLLKQADVALYQAKSAGRNSIRFFNPDMQAAINARTVMEAALRRSLQLGELRLHYQPQVDKHGNRTGAEALLRWQPATGKSIPPGVFIKLAEETGLILPIGVWVLETACAQLKLWQSDPNTRALTLAINVSARQFYQPDFVEQVWGHIKQSGVDPKGLKLELTESVVLDRVDEVVRRMQQLKALGVQFSLDDFGTGYSSLSYLKRLPLDQVKIDQSFVSDITQDDNDEAIVRAILAMSHSLGLQVIAEGVETEEQMQRLQNFGCEHFQGYLFGRPMPIEDW
jgi:diguanylate cyclase (GGDEF)-like protein/PAS domain S-box-containing protein